MPSFSEKISIKSHFFSIFMANKIFKTLSKDALLDITILLISIFSIKIGILYW